MGTMTPPAWTQQLAPEHAPAAVSFWPLAPGWWAVAAATLLLLVLALWWWRSRKAMRLRRLSLHQLAQLESLTDAHEQCAALEQLLRRYALWCFGRECIAALNGRRWLDFLAAHGAAGLAGERGDAFLRLAYGGRGEIDLKAVRRAAKRFIRRSRPPRKGLWRRRSREYVA